MRLEGGILNSILGYQGASPSTLKSGVLALSVFVSYLGVFCAGTMFVGLLYGLVKDPGPSVKSGVENAGVGAWVMVGIIILGAATLTTTSLDFRPF